jgi:hypothetical protein
MGHGSTFEVPSSYRVHLLQFEQLIQGGKHNPSIIGMMYRID